MVGRYEGSETAFLSHSRPSYEKFFSYDRRRDSRSRAPDRFAIGTRCQVYNNAHTRKSLQTPVRVAASPGLGKYYFFTFYGGT